MNRVIVSAIVLSLGLWAGGAANAKDNEPAEKKQADKKTNDAVVNIEPTKGNKAKGTVVFRQVGQKVYVVADISGLNANEKHAIHIHEGTECGEDGMAAGGHYNPEKHDHGLPDAPADKRHAGDFGNMQADDNGKAHLELTVDNISISGEKNPILGHAVIVHARADDGTQPTGNAGGRIGCGIIKAGKGESQADVRQKDSREYIVGPHDLLTISSRDPVTKEDAWARSSRISATGLLSLPNLPNFVQADGLSEKELARNIVEAYRDAGKPQAEIRITTVEGADRRSKAANNSPK